MGNTFATTPTTPIDVSSVAYLAVDDADALAASQVSRFVASYLAAGSADKGAALAQATMDIDRGMRFQGRKYDSAQTLEFPRVAYETAGRVMPHGIVDFVLPPAFTDSVWDWDPTNHVAIVPALVRQACLFQANFILAGGDPRQDDIHGGVNQSINRDLQETYDRRAPGVATGLCRAAWKLLERYQLVSGRFV